MSSFSWPSAPSGSNPSVANNGGPVATESTLIAGDAPGGIQEPISVDSSGNVNVNVVSEVPVTGTVTANQGTPAVIANAWPVELTEGGNIANVTAAGALQVDGSAVTQPVSVASLPLPTGAATSANQSTEITALGTINTTLGSPFQAGGSIGNTSFIATQASGANLHVNVDNFPATQPVSGTVAATQSGTWTVQPGNTANTTPWLMTIDQGGNAALVSAAGALKVDGSAVTQPVSGTFFQATQPVSGTVTVSNISTSSPVNTNGSFSQASISVASTITAPANAVGFLLETDSANTDFMRWTDSNSTASATNGMKLEPGRDTGFMPMSHSLSICPNSGSQTYTIQWVLSS
jgi:hypothetical protein